MTVEPGSGRHQVQKVTIFFSPPIFSWPIKKGDRMGSWCRSLHPQARCVQLQHPARACPCWGQERGGRRLDPYWTKPLVLRSVLLIERMGGCSALTWTASLWRRSSLRSSDPGFLARLTRMPKVQCFYYRRKEYKNVSAEILRVRLTNFMYVYFYFSLFSLLWQASSKAFYYPFFFFFWCHHCHSAMEMKWPQ